MVPDRINLHCLVVLYANLQATFIIEDIDYAALI